ncbi:MAG: phosphopantetheine-binding protein [Polyangiaceae bacterium]
MPTYDDTLQTTTDILKNHVDVGRPIRPSDHIQNDLGLDSLGVMEVVADIEDKFNVNIPNEMLANMITVEDVARALVKLQPQLKP